MKSRKRMQGDEGPRKERHEAVLHTTEVLVRIKKERSQEMVSDGARLANLEACRQLERRLYLSVPVPRQTGIVFHFHSIKCKCDDSIRGLGGSGRPRRLSGDVSKNVNPGRTSEGLPDTLLSPILIH